MNNLRIHFKNPKNEKRVVVFGLSASLLVFGALFFFAKTPNANAESSSDIVIRITNQGDGAINDIWDSPVNYSSSNPGCLASGTLNAQASVDLGNCAVGDTITISESVPGVSFRQWSSNNYNPLFSGDNNIVPMVNSMLAMNAFTTDSTNNNIKAVIDSMPAMNAFTTDSTGEIAGDNFFAGFNSYGALTSLPASSFNTSNITTAGDGFFGGFNSSGSLASLPAGSFNTSNITTAGDGFFGGFNSSGSLASLPAGSFNTSNITTAGDGFFGGFNSSGSLASLPAGSFNTSNITTAGDSFFDGFNSSGALTSLPAGSFDISKITTVGNYFFSYFNSSGSLASLPAGSFNTSNITTAGDSFFDGFNSSGALTSLPAGSFNTSNITTVGNDFFYYFNGSGSLTSLPAGSFNTSNITTVGRYFFYGFNSDDGKLTKASTVIPIKNTSSSSVNFQSWNGSSSDTTTIAPGDTFEFYGTNKWNYAINPDNGTLTGGTAVGTTDEGAQITLPTTATRTGYTFAGFTSNAWTGTKNLGETFTLTGDTEITATWTKNADPAPALTPTPTIPAAPNTGSTNKIAGATISSLIFASIIATIALFAKLAHKTLKSER